MRQQKKLKAGVAPKTVRDRLDLAFRDYLREYAKKIDFFLQYCVRWEK